MGRCRIEHSGDRTRDGARLLLDSTMGMGAQWPQPSLERGGALLGHSDRSWVFATIAVTFAEDRAKALHLRGGMSVAVVAAAYVLAYGISWVGRFALFNKVLFKGTGQI